MKDFLKNNQILAIVVGGVLASVIATWILSSGPAGLWQGLAADTRTIIAEIGTACLLVLAAATVAAFAARLGRIGAAQPAIAGGVSSRLKLLTSPERVALPSPLKAIEDLERMVGLAPVKREVNALIARLQLERKRLEQGHKPEKLSMHMVFAGPPGVGKTEVARALGGGSSGAERGAQRTSRRGRPRRPGCRICRPDRDQDADEMPRGARRHSVHRRGLQPWRRPPAVVPTSAKRPSTPC